MTKKLMNKKLTYWQDHPRPDTRQIYPNILAPLGAQGGAGADHVLETGPALPEAEEGRNFRPVQMLA